MLQSEFIPAVFSLASNLNGIRRFSMFKLFHDETVLEHTGMVILFCMLAGLRINKFEPGYLKLDELLLRACCHDLDETITGDVARPVKYSSDKVRFELARLEEIAVLDLSKMFGLPELAVFHAEAKTGREGYIVALVDFACAVHRCWEECLIHGNKSLIGTAFRMQEMLPKLRNKLPDDTPETVEVFYTAWLDEIQIILKKIAANNTDLLELH